MAELLVLTKLSLRRQLVRTRFFVALLVTAACVVLCFHKVPLFLTEQGMRIQAAEPFLMLFSDCFPQLFLLLSFLLLAGDVPFCHDGMEYVVTRSGKRKWLLAQLCALLGMTLIWLLWTLLCSIVVFRGFVDFSGKWSTFTKLIARNLGQLRIDTFGFELGVHPSANMIGTAGPYGMLALSFLLELLLFADVGAWCMALNLWTRRSYGCALTVSFWLLRFGLQLNLSLYSLNRFSPLSLADVHTAPMTGARIAWVLGFFLAQIVPLLVLSLRRVRMIDLTKLR